MFLTALLLAACAGDDTDRCEGWPDEPQAITGVVDSDSDDCGYWELPLGEHLYTNVYVLEELAECSYSLGDGLALFAEPTWSNFQGGGMKWTYDVIGEHALDDWSAFEVSCDDGSAFSARILVTD